MLTRWRRHRWRRWPTIRIVIGYFTDSELDWGPLLGNGAGSPDTALQQYLQLPAGSPGLAVAQQYVGNPSGFVTALATRYFSVTSAALHMYDTNHLILGVKAEGSEIEPNLIKAAAPYVDVFSIEDYSLQPIFQQIPEEILACLSSLWSRTWRISRPSPTFPS